MHPLTEIVCGKTPCACNIGEILEHLGVTFDRLIVKATKLRDSGDKIELALFGPMLGRGLLEVAFTALIGRLDPFRILLLREVQKQSSYALDKRSGLAINWQYDIQGEKLDYFKPETKMREVSRALLGSPYQDAFWGEACQTMLDAVPFHRGGEWMTRLRLYEPDTFATRLRGEADAAYSICSKGIHHEFVISPGAYYDSVTIGALLQRVFEVIAFVSLAANMCNTLVFKPSVDRLLGLFEEAQEELTSA